MTRNDDGTLPSWAWPGGYPLYYQCRDGGTLCPDCANGGNGSLAYVGKSLDGIDDGQWEVVGQDVNYEDDSLYCGHCNTKVESAYVD
ncbi:hypothetical protein TA3x_001994 [Tundrisphaera sp. TA3]|uniref:hypothetical protein n=1 Tax=Tundrisphaera sp. TA3 TaxID=3435775 RepID=UPI003EBAF0EB